LDCKIIRFFCNVKIRAKKNLEIFKNYSTDTFQKTATRDFLKIRYKVSKRYQSVYNQSFSGTTFATYKTVVH
jgi:hypothetical protein